MAKQSLVILTFCAIFFLFASNTAAQEIVVLKGADLKPYNDALMGIKDACKSDIKEFQLSGTDDSGIINKIRSADPKLVIVIGQGALSVIKEVIDIPVVYAMVSNPDALLSSKNNTTGVSMNVSVEQQLDALLRIVPDVKRIGIVYDPRKTLHLFEEARKAAMFSGVTLVSRETGNPKEVPSIIKDMKGKIDAFWMLPDTTVFSSESVKYLHLFSMENRVPVLTFSKKYVKMGSLISLDVNAVDVGRQAGEIANQIIDGRNIRNIKLSSPRKAVLTTNLWVADWFKINRNIIQKVENQFKENQ
jgi:putative ABC transport system substrate-binding protein